MNNHFLYFFLDLGAVIIPFIASFYTKAPFYKLWRFLPLAIGLPALFFILWDIAFTSLGIWGFNYNYLIGIQLFNLPLEELLFFICIPYACVFTYFAFCFLIRKNILKTAAPYISKILIIFLMITGLVFIEKWYTATTFIGLAAFLSLHQFVWRSEYMGRFYFTFLVILLPFVLINGILTGSMIEDQVVWYNDAENLGIRIFTIPVEDAFYGMFLILMNVTILEKMSGSLTKYLHNNFHKSLPGVSVKDNPV